MAPSGTSAASASRLIGFMAFSFLFARDKTCRFLPDVSLRPESDDIILQCGNLGQIGPHLPVPGKGGSRSHA
jgi:hypothetical protein